MAKYLPLSWLLQHDILAVAYPGPRENSHVSFIWTVPAFLHFILVGDEEKYLTFKMISSPSKKHTGFLNLGDTFTTNGDSLLPTFSCSSPKPGEHWACNPVVITLLGLFVHNRFKQWSSVILLAPILAFFMSYSRLQWQTAKTFLKLGNLGLFLFVFFFLLAPCYWNGHPLVIGHLYPQELTRFYFWEIRYFLFCVHFFFLLAPCSRNGHPLVIGHLYPQELTRFLFLAKTLCPAYWLMTHQAILEPTKKHFFFFASNLLNLIRVDLTLTITGSNL